MHHAKKGLSKTFLVSSFEAFEGIKSQEAWESSPLGFKFLLSKYHILCNLSQSLIICTYSKSVRPYPTTMLQKLSKCEVKAWLCSNMIILPPLNFYMKYSFGEFKQSKNVIFLQFWRLWTLNFGNFGTWKLL